jgi:phospholipid/cholesterol/gamma-HCH transport system substrate-binding protein
MHNAQQTARVGLFFLLGMALIWVTFETLSGGKIIRDKGYEVIAGFDTLKELKEGDDVRMAGVKIGEVAKTRLAGRRAEALLRIDSHQVVKADAAAVIITNGLIGTAYVSIDLGSDKAAALKPGAEIRTQKTPDLNEVMAQIGDLGKKLDGALQGISGAFAGDGRSPGLVQRIDQLVTDNRENLSRATANLQLISDKVNRGEGTLGKLINDPRLHDELVAGVADLRGSATQARNFLASAQGVLDEVKAGRGTLGALVFDQKAGDDLKASLTSLRSVSERLSRGEGTLGKLLGDETLLRDMKSLMRKADRALDGMGDSGPLTAVGILANGLF